MFYQYFQIQTLYDQKYYEELLNYNLTKIFIPLI